MKKTLLLFLLLAATSLPTIAQKQGQELIDSLQASLKTYDAHRTELNITGYNITDTSLVTILNNLSMELIKIGEFAKAKQNADDAMAISEKIDFKKGTANAYNNIGLINGNQGNYPEAYQQTLKKYIITANVLKAL